MSQYFDMGEETLWNPSNGASRLFQQQVAVFEAELGLPSGIAPMVCDECQIDPDTFKVFVDALLARHRRTSHSVVIALTEGFVATVLVLAGRARVGVDWRIGEALHHSRTDVQVPAPASVADVTEEAWVNALRQKVRALDRSMAR